MKKTKISDLLRKFLLLAVLFSFAACATISTFDQYAYTQTTTLKVDALNTMTLATDEYAINEKSVQELQTNLQKIYEYEKNRPKNEINIQLWDKMIDTNGHLLGGFLKRWQNEKKLNAVFVQEEKKIVGEAFDQIAGLESHKIKPPKP
jgi:hypothetical protein